ncbi:hypothetical protein H4R33_003792 [Dimargaris cristalligena]|uniref:Mitochondrial PGP phosphatase-domain-containing protein n=1 Tax=Dimargaris cristalligena TaxID=215637 RepID=A0A4P9ZSB3_9FUNG|nr:hypothetical protein H4R33_003792 [Dimargaris cristalligena]RKP36434.1 mitochondrial PGP phosphatase-domain-containing protein [Dimargaris cristalligena]|eukprot:RKP36434.1 mitochondrial PGP phosphatase-domain-containing protein [Dimargaris cristalligena]
MGQSFNGPGIRAAASVLWRPRLLIPHQVVTDIRAVDFSALRKQGIRAIGFDKDNCLTRPYESTLYPPFRGAWEQCLETFGADHVVIVSNSAGTPDDSGYTQAQTIERDLGVPVLRHPIKKPAGGDELLAHFAPLPPSQIAFVGDRLMTDIVFGHRYGLFTIWTRQIVSAKGDNPVAARLRGLEYRIYDFLKGWKWQAPAHPSQK